MGNNGKNIELNLLLKAADGMSGVVKKTCEKTDTAFDKTNKTLDETADNFAATGNKAEKFSEKMNIVKKTCEQTDGAFDKSNKKLEDLAGKFDSAGKKVAVFGTALIGVSALNVKTAGDFEQEMNNVSTLIDTNIENLEEMKKKILDIGKNSPKSLNDLTQGLYSIRSAGISAADQFRVLKGSEMLAVSGLATTAEAVDIATSAINAFNLKGEEQDKIYDTLNKAVAYGKLNISEFAQGFGSVAGVVSAAGIKLDEYSAAVAAMTTSGLKANNVHTQMSAAISSLTRNSKEQAAIFNQLGAKSFKDLIQKSGGMVEAFKKIDKAAGGDEAKIIALMGSVNGYKAVMSLTNTVNGKFTEALNGMRYGAETLTEAYNKQMSGLNNQMAAMRNNLQVLSIKFGNALLPVVKAATGGVKSLAAVFDKLPDGLTSFLAIAAAGIGVISVFGGTVLMFAGSLIRNFMLLKKVISGFSIAAWANPALLPVIGVTAAIAALAAGAVYCYNKFEGFRNICNGLWSVIKALGACLAVLWQSFVTGAIQVWDFIKPAVKFAGIILSWTTPIGLVTKAIQGLFKWIGSLIEKAGGLRTIGKNIGNWADDKKQKAENLNAEIKQNRVAQRTEKQVKVNGSHADGLDFVPYDGYIAEVHKGEAVLSEKDADLWRRGGNNNNKEKSIINIEFNPVVNIQNATQEAKEDFLKILKQYKNEIADMVESAQNRRMARAY